MEEQPSSETLLTQAEALPPQDLSKLVSTLGRLLVEKYGKWADLNRVDEVQDYIEWVRFCDSHHADGSRKSLEEFLADLASE